MTQLYKEESIGAYGQFEVEINVDATILPDLKDDRIRTASYEAAKLIKAAVMGVIVENNKGAQDRRITERKLMTSLFKSPIFIEEIPNGYCSDWCCKHLPWFNITTSIGIFTIGWRRSVISIDWSKTVGTKTSDELFEDEDVTKDKNSIHAHGIENAQRYITSIFASADKTNI